ncbi:MAG: TIGR04282 family arsenosugar biosynthesis glycosyltransferase [Geobacteraceae bacterium]
MKQALIIFARQPLPGQVKTRLTPPLTPEEAAELYRGMLLDILARTRALVGVERLLFHSGESEADKYFRRTSPDLPIFPQIGSDLGERMTAAFETAFALGHKRVAIIGSDSPDLPLDFIAAAFTELASGRHEAIFGPTEDGGYYLIAMSRLRRELFQGITWGSGTVLKDSLRQADSAGIKVALLQCWYDVDTASDLARPMLRNEANGAPLTREFIRERIPLLHWPELA